MKVQKTLIIFGTIIMTILCISSSYAGDFDWMKDFNIRAEADPSGFKARLATRFNIGDTQINTVMGISSSPADTYMIFRLGEMSGKPTDYVMGKYKSNKGKGWGNLAKSLGIKPGSKEFHALKNGSDLYSGTSKSEGKNKNKNKGKGKN